jgi:hypothetical protein
VSRLPAEVGPAGADWPCQPTGDGVNQAEALQIGAHVLHVKAWSLMGAGGHSNYADRIQEAARVLQRLESLYDPGSDAWTAVPQ